MSVPDRYLKRIRTVYPTLDLNCLEFNQDGMNNDVIIVDQKLVCRFAKIGWARQD
jgi:aminoglycoside 2''-phosphotransferase